VRGMGKMEPRAQRSWRGILLALLGVLCSGAGCVHVSETLDPSAGRSVSSVMEESRKAGAFLPSLESGMRAFQEEDFPRAADIFASLAQALPSQEGKRKALYGLACSRLASAKDMNSFKEAMALWEQWQEQMAGEMGSEDPRMLTQVLRRLATWSPPPETRARRPAPSTSAPGKTPLSKEEEIRQKDEEIRVRDEEIERLREQIEDLENIHRAIQQKKREAASP